MRKVIALLLGGIVCLPAMARAEKERKSPLTDAPVIRKRLELRDKRFEFGVGAGVTIGQDFTNALLVMPKLAFHFTDWLSLAAVGGFNLTPGWKTTFNNDVMGKLPPPDQIPFKSPHPDEAAWEMNRIGYLLVGQIEFIPLSGKIALLSSLFSYFDFYVLLGGGVVNLAKTNASLPQCLVGDNSVSTNPVCQGRPFTKTEMAGNVGAGAHAFITHYAAINLEIRDLLYKNNPSGRNVNGDHTSDGINIVDNGDLEWTNNWIFSLNVQFFLPIKAKISR
ncbi:MAG TPA: outer membrane beta-barrel domain-containing protein [Polyangia bacterium]